MLLIVLKELLNNAIRTKKNIEKVTKNRFPFIGYVIHTKQVSYPGCGRAITSGRAWRRSRPIPDQGGTITAQEAMDPDARRRAGAASPSGAVKPAMEPAVEPAKQFHQFRPIFLAITTFESLNTADKILM